MGQDFEIAVLIQWLPVSRADIARLYDFLYAARKIDELLDAIESLPAFPRVGHAVDRFTSQDIRAWISGDYEVRYEITGDAIVILRVWHTREDR